MPFRYLCSFNFQRVWKLKLTGAIMRGAERRARLTSNFRTCHFPHFSATIINDIYNKEFAIA